MEAFVTALTGDGNGWGWRPAAVCMETLGYCSW